MADVTPPGEGPPPLGHEVDLEKIGAKPAPNIGGWPVPPNVQLHAIKNPTHYSPPLTAEHFKNGITLLVTTPDGDAEVLVSGTMFVLTKPFGGLSIGQIVHFDHDNRVVAINLPPVEPFKPFPEPGYSKDKGKTALEALQGLHDAGMVSTKTLMGGFLNKGGPAPETPEQKKARVQAAKAAKPQDAEPQGPPQVPAHPGRAGRAIELD